MNIAAYVRASTLLQEDSPEVQLALIHEYCTRQGHQTVAAYADTDVSGGTEIESRPAFRQLLADRQTLRFDAVVILKIDRFSRNLFDFLSFERAAKRHKLKVLYATETYEDSASGDLMKHIKVTFAEYERKQTGERIVQHNRHLAATGRLPSGRPPLGYLYDPLTKVISINPERAGDVIAVFEAYCAAQGNCCHTARSLNVAGICTRFGGLWRDDGVAAIIRNPFYRCRMHYADIDVYTDNIPPLVPTELLRRTDALLVTTRGHRTRAAQQVYTYSGLLVCEACGCSFKVHRSGPDWTIYACRGRRERGICTASMVTTTWLDPLVTAGLVQALSAEMELLSQVVPDGDDGAEIAARQIRERKVAYLHERKRRTTEMYAAGVLDSIDDLKARIAECDRMIVEAQETAPIARTFTVADLERLTASLVGEWDTMSMVARHSLLLALCPRILVREKGRIRLDTALSTGVIDLPATAME